MLICPSCGSELERMGNTLRCNRKHSFDLSAQGYANLLLSNQKNSQNPGDNAAMVNGRTRFLDSGSYEPLSDALNETILGLCHGLPRILDAGCGEGYYAARLLSEFSLMGKQPHLYGVDISKLAVRHAAKRSKAGQFVVASLFELPVATGSIDICYNVFSPICAEEFTRVLAQGGYFVAVYPAARHLFGLKEILYEAPYENDEKTFELDGLKIAHRRRVSYTFHLQSNALIESLFSMTPYYYKTPIEGSKRLAVCELLTTEADFWIITYQKETL
ncbi:methyltransferase domain-containing protein [Oscillospiraceae bacterium PP1C4]